MKSNGCLVRLGFYYHNDKVTTFKVFMLDLKLEVTIMLLDTFSIKIVSLSAYIYIYFSGLCLLKGVPFI